MTDGTATATWRRIGKNWVVVVSAEYVACVNVGTVVTVVARGGGSKLMRLTRPFRSGPGYRYGTYHAVPA
jgi:hypothetical protein